MSRDSIIAQNISIIPIMILSNCRISDMDSMIGISNNGIIKKESADILNISDQR